ncbi:MAG: radical SAM protein [Clostridiales bacterium]|nr:radical SAM protein [Clostridiales bacterium]
MEPLIAKHLLTPVKGSMEDFFYADWNMNLYRGCSHGCVYCDSRSVCYQIDHFETVRPKENALSLLEREMRSKRDTGVITMGSMSDPYNPLEEKLQLTRQALEMIRRYRFGAAFTTKSALCARDAALLSEVSRHAPVCARMTVTCADDALCRKLEPHVAVTSERFQAIRTLADHGVFTGVWLNPVLPFLTDDEANLRRIVQMTADNGGRFVVCFFGMTLRTGNREYFFDALERDFPGVREKYLCNYGNSYELVVPDAERRYDAFREECVRQHLHWRFSDINQEMFSRMPQQTSLFD